MLKAFEIYFKLTAINEKAMSKSVDNMTNVLCLLTKNCYTIGEL